jgi:hypothetical protein
MELGKIVNRLLLAGSFALGAATVNKVEAADIYFDRSAWEAKIADLEQFPTYATNILKADEIETIPGHSEYLGRILTFNRTNTATFHETQEHNS